MRKNSSDPKFIENIKNKLSSSIGNNFSFRRVENVGLKVSKELLNSGIIAICVSLFVCYFTYGLDLNGNLA